MDLPPTPPPRRRPLRHPAFDYSSQGAYFVTIVTRARECVLGAVGGGCLQLSAAGRMVDAALRRVPSVFPGVSIDEHVVMPNHVHALIDILPAASSRGVSLIRVVASLKSFTTCAYRIGMRQGEFEMLPGPLWQRGYHDRIVRDAEEYHAIRAYIRDNPLRWCVDRDNPRRGIEEVGGVA